MKAIALAILAVGIYIGETLAVYLNPSRQNRHNVDFVASFISLAAAMLVFFV